MSDDATLASRRSQWDGLRILSSLSWPLLVSSLASLLSGVIDVAVMGHTSAEALAGVSAATAVFTVVLTICQPIASAHQIGAARSFGANDSSATRTSLTIALRTGLILGACAAAALFLLAPLALDLTTAGPVAAAEGTAYLRVRSTELLLFIPVTLLIGTLNSAKLARPGMWAMLVGNVVNVAADIVLVLDWGLGGLGSALGNVLGCLAALAILVLAFRRRADSLGLGPLSAALRRPVPRRGVLDFVAVAWPLGISGLLDNTGALVIFGIIGSAGDVGGAHARVAYTVMFVAFIVVRSFATGGQILIGRAADDPAERSARLGTTFLATVALAVTASALLVCFADPVAAVLLSSAPSDYVPASSVAAMALVLPVMAVTLVLSADVKARGRTRIDMYANIAAVWLVQVPVAVVTIGWGGGPATAMVLAYAAYWASRTGLLAVLRHGTRREAS